MSQYGNNRLTVYGIVYSIATVDVFLKTTQKLPMSNAPKLSFRHRLFVETHTNRHVDVHSIETARVSSTFKHYLESSVAAPRIAVHP